MTYAQDLINHILVDLIQPSDLAFCLLVVGDEDLTVFQELGFQLVDLVVFQAQLEREKKKKKFRDN